jgi:CubicO group peptidase (beta-lactamase class C family)
MRGKRSPSGLASLSKPFTALAIKMLAEQGRLSYDDPIARYFPELPEALGAATVRQLLNHTSGIPDYSSDLNAERPGMTPRDVLNLLRNVKSPVFPPGEKYEYSNTGYVLLGLIAEKVSGKPFLTYLQEKIFDPLGMKTTFALPRGRVTPANVANGYDDFGKLSNANSYLGGDGGLYSTIDDLYRFDQARCTSGIPGTPPVIGRIWNACPLRGSR